MAVNAIKKVALEGGLPQLLELVLPCHVFNGLGAYCILSGSRAAREHVYSLLLFSAWMPLMALAFPDTRATEAIENPLLRVSCVALFWVHHLCLLVLPAALYGGARFRAPVGRRAHAAAYAGYLSFVFPYIGVGLCSLAVATGWNANYSLWPPSLPQSILDTLGGPWYRVTIGCFLAFVLGPAMRYALVPLMGAVLRGATRGAVSVLGAALGTNISPLLQKRAKSAKAR